MEEIIAFLTSSCLLWFPFESPSLAATEWFPWRARVCSLRDRKNYIIYYALGLQSPKTKGKASSAVSRSHAGKITEQTVADLENVDSVGNYSKVASLTKALTRSEWPHLRNHLSKVTVHPTHLRNPLSRNGPHP